MIIRKIKVKFRMIDSLCIPNYKIEIYDKYHNLVFDEFADESGCICFDATYFGIYKIVIYNFYLQKMCIPIFVSENNSKELSIILDETSINKRSIAMNLTDQNYKDLPINRGEIILWKK